MGNDIKIEPGSMWFRADDFNAKVNILTADDDVIRYEYLKRNDNDSTSIGRANRDQFLKIFIKWDDEYERFRPGSIWEAVRGCGQESKGKKIKITGIFGDIVKWVFLDNFEKTEDHCTCKSSFSYCFTRIADNDNGAIYRSIKRPISVVKVKNTTPSFLISPLTVQAFTSVEYTEIKSQKYWESHITNGNEFHFKYELFSMNPEKDFVFMPTEKTIPIPNEEETKMENNGTYLKTDASKLEDFGTGAKREDKTGKGRYDLIPGDVMSELEDFAWETYFNNGVTTCSATDVSKSAYFDDWTNVELYYDFIVNVISYFFAKDHIKCTDDCGEISYEVNWDIFRSGLYEMRKQLALHYEAGAVVHGVDNWKKGLPVYGSARGGCFLDSMRRHIDQALMGLTDEPHAVAALWNAFCAVWTLEHRPNSAMYQNDSAVKAEEKFGSTHFDMIDSAIDALKGMNKDKDAVYLTLPSGRKLKFTNATGSDDENDFAIIRALIHNDKIAQDVFRAIKDEKPYPSEEK